MVRVKERKTSNPLTTRDNNEVIRHLEQAIMNGKHWYLALLEAIGLWETTQEDYDGRSYHYLIAGEAFDWLLLAERLCRAVNGLIPVTEKTSLLLHGRPPLRLPVDTFKQLIGDTKYNQYLNYFYGITVEEALVVVVEEEVRKERWTSGYSKEKDTTGEAYRRIYGRTMAVLLRRFRRDRGYSQLKSISLSQLKEFTYWLFKLRLKRCDKAKVASDTKKALLWLESKGFSQYMDTRYSAMESICLPLEEPAG